MYRGHSQKCRQMRFSGACVMHTCESYRERRKTCELFRALTVVTTEKFTGNGESGKKARKRKYIYIKKTRFIFISSAKQVYRLVPKLTREKLHGGSTQLNLLIDFKGEVWLLSPLSADAQPCL